MALYLALNTVYGLALSVEDVRAIVDDPANPHAFKPDAVAPIAQLAAERLFGRGLSDPFSLAVGLTLLASVSAYVLTGPRVAYAMAQAGQFPAIAGRLSPRTGTPVIATVLQVAWSLVLLWTGSFDLLLTYSSVGLALFSMLTVSSVYALRWRRPDLPRPFSTPGYPVTPAIFLARHRPDRVGDLLRTPPGLDLFAPEHPGGRPRLLPLGRIQGPRRRRRPTHPAVREVPVSPDPAG